MMRLFFLIVLTALLSFQGSPAYASEERAETIEAVIESGLFLKQSKQSKVKRIAPPVFALVITPPTVTFVSIDRPFIPFRRPIFYRVLLI